MTEPPGRIIAMVDGKNGYKALIVSFRERIMELGTHMEAVDAVAGLPTRYTGKLLDIQIKEIGQRSYNLGRDSLGPLLGALGLKLAVMVDDDAEYKIKQGLNGLRKRGTKGPNLAKPNNKPAYDTFGRLGRAKYLLVSSRTERRTIAYLGAMVRWQEERKRKAKLEKLRPQWVEQKRRQRARCRELRRKLTTLAEQGRR